MIGPDWITLKTNNVDLIAAMIRAARACETVPLIGKEWFIQGYSTASPSPFNRYRGIFELMEALRFPGPNFIDVSG